MAQNQGQRFGAGELLAERYEVVRSLGSGSIGEVYHVLDTALDFQSIALKVLHGHLLRDEVVLKRFQNEVLITRQLAHENIVRSYDFINDEHGSFLSMEYVAGCNLAEILSGYDNHRMPLQEVLYILVQLAQGLAHAHAQNIIHRDLKPENILLNTDSRVKLTDFGLARSVERSHGMTRTGELIGSPAYLAPEQFRQAHASSAADVYALGILSFELLTGKLPFQGDSLVALALAHQQDALPIDLLEKRGVPEWLCVLIDDCCRKDPAKRVASVNGFLARVEEYSSNAESKSRLLLQTLIKKRSQDQFLMTKAHRFWLTAIWAAVILTIVIFVLLEPGSRMRIMSQLTRLELQQGIRLERLQTLVFGKYYDPHSPEDLLYSSNLASDQMLNGLIDGGASLEEQFQDETMDTVLHRMIRENSTQLVPGIFRSTIVDRRNAAGETPLLLAIKQRARFATGALLAIRANLDIPDKEGNYPLLVAVAGGQHDAIRSMLTRFNYQPRRRSARSASNEGIPSSLRYNMNDLNRSVRSKAGYGALHIAVLSGRRHILDDLLLHGFDVHIRDAQGRTPLMLAVALVNDVSSEAMIRALIEAGSDLQSLDNEGRSVVDHVHPSQRQLLSQLLGLPIGSLS